MSRVRRPSAIRGAWSSQVGDLHARRDGIRMVTEWGEGKAEAFRPDAHGRFRTRGHFRLVTEDRARIAVFLGVASERRIRLTVHLPGGCVNLGPFELLGE